MPAEASIAWPVAPLQAEPDRRAPLDSELLFGEAVTVLEQQGEWRQVAHRADGYRGWLPEAALGPAVAATHVVTALSAPVQRIGGLKQPYRMRLPWLARVALTGAKNEDWFEIAGGGYLHRAHIAPQEQQGEDPVAEAERLLGQPYIWGGRSAWGLDCSALVQLSLAACGISSPRDSGDQQAALGQPVAPPYRRGDLAFFPGHVGFMLDDRRLLHANAFRMAVTVDPLDEVIPRAGALGAVKRIIP